jgi:hypothetical protein
MKKSGYFITLKQDINIQNGDCLASFDVICLFTKIPVEEVSQVIRNRLSIDPSPSERSYLQDGYAIELLDMCLTSTL